jgi:hypothetical protein
LKNVVIVRDNGGHGGNGGAGGLNGDGAGQGTAGAVLEVNVPWGG